MRRLARHTAAALALTLVTLAAPAGAVVFPREFALSATPLPAGGVSAFVYGPAGTTVQLGEQVGGTLRPRRSVVIGPGGLTFVPWIAHWRCDRLTRTFVAWMRGADPVAFALRTPSCGKRLSLELPRRARLGRPVTLRLLDHWNLAGLHPRLCRVRPEGRRPRCRILAFRRGGATLTKRLRFTRAGRWRLEIRTRHQRIRRVVAVGRHVKPPRDTRPLVLLTGDSMMDTLDNIVIDRLEPDLAVESDPVPAAGLSKEDYLAGLARARRLQRSFRPVATVAFLGTNDSIAMKTPAGATVPCCGEAWIAEYTRRVEVLMGTYKRTVLYLTIPAPRDPRRRAFTSAVNEGIRRAAAASPKAELLDAAKIFTPGFEYRATMPYRGRNVRVRTDDGIHLSVAGARIAATEVIRRLRSLHVLPASG